MPPRADAENTLDLIARVDGAVRGVIVNRATTADNPERIASELGVELLGMVPDDPVVPASADAGKPILVHQSESAAAAAMRAIAGQLMDGEADHDWTALVDETPAGEDRTPLASEEPNDEAVEPGSDEEVPADPVEEDISASSSSGPPGWLRRLFG